MADILKADTLTHKEESYQIEFNPRRKNEDTYNEDIGDEDYLNVMADSGCRSCLNYLESLMGSGESPGRHMPVESDKPHFMRVARALVKASSIWDKKQYDSEAANEVQSHPEYAAVIDYVTKNTKMKTVKAEAKNYY